MNLQPTCKSISKVVLFSVSSLEPSKQSERLQFRITAFFKNCVRRLPVVERPFERREREGERAGLMTGGRHMTYYLGRMDW